MSKGTPEPDVKERGEGADGEGAPRASRSSLAIVYATVFIDLLGFGIILPLLPYYAERYGATGVWLGAILTAYSGAQFIGAPLLGRLSDKVGRRPVLLVALAGSAISLSMTAVADGLIALVAARGLAGIFGGSIATAQAFIADVTDDSNRAKFMGLLGASIGMGFVFGPATGAFLSRWGFSTAAWAAAGLAAINFSFAYFRLEEPARPQGRLASERGQITVRNLARSLAQPTIGLVVAATFLATFAFVVMETTFPYLGEAVWGLGEMGLGLTLMYIGVVVVIVQGGLIGRIVPRIGEQRTAVIGSAIMAVSLAALPHVPSWPLALATLGLLAVGQGFVSPTLATLLSRAARVDQQGSTLGVGQGMGAAARAIGPITAGWLYDVRMDIPYWLATVSVAFAALSLARLGARVGMSSRRAVS